MREEPVLKVPAMSTTISLGKNGNSLLKRARGHENAAEASKIEAKMKRFKLEEDLGLEKEKEEKKEEEKEGEQPKHEKVNVMFQTGSGSTAKKVGATCNLQLPPIVYPGELLDCVLRNEDEDRVMKACALFQRGALVGFLIWVILLALMLKFAPADSYEQPHGIEQSAHVVTFILLLVTNGSRLYPFILRDKNLNFFKNGVLVAIATVQMIAMISNLGMGLLPTPVFDDQITGLRVYLVRWVEFIPLCFLMTFLLDNMDAPLSINDPPQRWSLAIMLTLATACGGIFPFCRNLKEWLMVVTTAWCLFTSLFFKLYAQAKRYYAMKADVSPKTPTGVEASDDELFELARVSYTLTCICTITWTLLAACFTFIAAAQAWAPKDSLLAEPHLQNVMLSVFDVMSKIWYLSGIIDAYDNFFDESARAVRRLENLRNFMTAIWESSSDILIFTGNKENRVHARISPAFFRMIGAPNTKQGSISLILEIFPKTQTYYVFAIDLSKTVTRDEANDFRQTFTENPRSLKDSGTKSIEDQNIAILAAIAIKGCGAYVGNGNERSFQQDLTYKNRNNIKCSIRCEAKVADFERGSCLIVLRNISDRVQRFEAEKNLLRESTIRRKDAEANQFTRHEVKNGILAAIGILEHLRESTTKSDGGMETISKDTNPTLTRRSYRRSTTDLSAAAYSSASTATGSDEYDELESTLKDILDTVLYEAMAREIIYGEYEPRRERLNVPAVLASLQHGSSKLFPLTFEPSPFPNIFLDRQLLRYIFRNAVLNASRYGQPDGIVETKARFDHAESKFIMEVINLPGPGHQDLVKLSREEVLQVFEPGAQLSITRSAAHTHHAESTKNESQGSGAWIMKLSAEALGGECNIRFEPTRTVFTFWSPAKAFDREEFKPTQGFRLPSSVWGVAVDDSKVQRKLLGHFMKIAGIDASRRVVLGENDDEITSFGERLKKLLLENPDAKFLVIADENLDMSDGMQKTISGSLSVQRLREELDEETESRMLVLIRSANDSASDVETYKSRAHGFMRKEPIKKGEVLDVIQPWWDARFPPDGEELGDSQLIDKCSDGLEYGPSSSDIEESLQLIDALVSVENVTIIISRWKVIRDKLHALTGDLKTMSTERNMHDLIAEIIRMRHQTEVPEGFRDLWNNLRNQIHDAVFNK
jgi:signal transduction histidine kinase